MKQVELTVDGLKDFARHIIKTNVKLQEENKFPLALEVVGESGMGKTSSIIQLASELNLDVVKLNLAQIEELGDLVGFPIEEFEMAINKGTAEAPNWDVKWIKKPLLQDAREKGYSATGKSRMGYSAPEWISGRSKGGILILDDWNRADPRFVQAVMELIDRQEYISWKLPKGWTIILTANPDNGDYNVTSQDSAQKTRYISANLKFDHKVWANWAEKDGIDGRCINFLLLNHEIITKDVNARSITKFFNSISSIKNFSDDLPMINMLGDGSIGPEASVMFVRFIADKLDKLVSPERMLTHKNFEEVKAEIKDCVYDSSKYRSDIASVLTRRFANYALKLAETGAITEAHIQRIADITTDACFGPDLQYAAVRELISRNRDKFRGLLMFEQVTKTILLDE